MIGRETDFLRRLLAPALLSLSLAACGGGGDGDGGNNPDPDPDPDPDQDTIEPFTFTPVDNAAPGEAVYSNEVTLAGFSEAINISVDGGAYCINLVKDEETDNCVDTAGTVSAGDKLSLRATAPEGSGEHAEVTVSLDDGADLSYSTSFVVATRVDSSLPPEAVAIPPVKGLEPGGQGFSDAVIVDGFTGVLSVNADDGVLISVNGAPFTAGPVDIVAGQAIAFQVPAPAEAGGQGTLMVRFSNGENEIASEIQVHARDAAAGGPEDFSFTPVTGAELDTDVITNPVVTLTGDFADLPVSISGGEYSVGEDEFTAAPGTVDSGDFLALRVHTSVQFETESRARVTIGEGDAAITRYFRATTMAEPEGVNRPDPFVFGKHVNAEPGDVAESRIVTLGGFDGELPVSVEAPAEALAQLRVNDTAATDGTLVSAGDSVQLSATAAADFATSHVIVLHVGEGDDRQDGTFEVATRAKDVTPLPFSFGSAAQADHGEEKVSPAVTLAGFDGALPVELIAEAAANAQASINDGAFSQAPGTISAGQTLRIKATAPGADQAPQRNVTVRVGSGETAIEATFTLVTADVVPDDFSFGNEPLLGNPGEILESSVVTVTGFDGELDIDVDGPATVSINGLPGEKITAGQTLQVLAVAPLLAGKEETVTVHVGEGSARKSASIDVRTKDVQPDSFSFAPATVPNADPSSVHMFTSTPLSGFVGSIDARVEGSGAQFRVIRNGENSPLDAATKPVIAGDVIELFLTASENIDATVNALVTVGDLPNLQGAGVNITTGDNVAPEFTIDFPTAKSVTQAETITLTGRFTENHLPGQAIVRGFNDDGEVLEGIVRADGYWQMVVDLDVGHNLITLEMTDSVGHRSTQQSVEIMRDSDFFTDAPRAVAYDEDENILYVLDGDNTFISIDLDTRKRLVVSSSSVGTGEELSLAKEHVLLDKANGRLLTIDVDDRSNDNVKLLSIDIDSGARSVVLGGISEIGGLALGKPGKLLTLTQNVGEAHFALNEVDLETGISTLVSKLNERGGGPTLGIDVVDVDYDPQRDNIYVLARAHSGFGRKALVRIDYETGDRTLISSNDGTAGDDWIGDGPGMNIPAALFVDTAVNDVYVLDRGAPPGQLDLTHPVLRIDVSNPDTLGDREVVSSDDDRTYHDLVSPQDMLGYAGNDGELHLLIADRGIAAGLVDMPATEKNPQTLVPLPVAAGGGADFDAPFRLELDAENDRLLVLSETSLQTVGISDGLRSEKVYEVPEGDDRTFGGLHLAEDQLWLTTNGTFRGVATIDRSDLATDAAVLTQRFTDFTNELEFSSDLMVEGALDDAVVYLATDFQTGDFIKKIEFTDGNASGISSVIELAEFDENLTISRYAPHQMIVSDPGLRLLDAASESLLFDDGMLSSTVTFDESRRYLYRMDSIDLYRHDWQVPGEPGDQQFLVGDRWPLPGTRNDPSDLRNIVIDSQRNRLYGLLDDGRNVVAINVAEILLDADGNPARAPEDVDPEADPQPSGEAVLISRSENLGLEGDI